MNANKTRMCITMRPLMVAQGMRAEEAANKFALSSPRTPMPAVQAIVMQVLRS